MKRTKIVCTIGPSSGDYNTIKALAEAGMDVARLNFSHGTQEEKAVHIKLIRQISSELDKPIAIMADLQGPKIRLGDIEGTRQIRKGEEIVLSLNPVGDDLPMQFDLSPFVKKDERIFLNDGLVELVVKGVKGKTIYSSAQNSGWVSSHKGVNIPDTRLRDYVFTQKDHEDAEFALKQGVEYLAVSFIQTPEDLEPALNLVKMISPRTKIVVKLEKNEAVSHLEEIVKKTDAIMVARGDLAVEARAASVPLIQKKIIRLARQYQRPVIVATQMLESMIENPRPTRAEVSDVANAVLDQVDAVMLSAESASGKYPLEAVEVMTDVIETVEADLYSRHYIRINWENIPEKELRVSAIASSAASLSYKMGAKIIAVATTGGKTARLISSFRPDTANLVAITHDQTTWNQLALVWGLTPFVLKPTKSSDTFWQKITDKLKKEKLVQKDDRVVLVGGSAVVGVSGAIDTIKVVTI